MRAAVQFSGRSSSRWPANGEVVRLEVEVANVERRDFRSPHARLGEGPKQAPVARIRAGVDDLFTSPGFWGLLSFFETKRSP
jgi:hypothetical protein